MTTEASVLVAVPEQLLTGGEWRDAVGGADLAEYLDTKYSAINVGR